ncbi:MAG: CPBP family intramembrane glutamic endopeptidase [Anaerovoracaceae bacterium]|jgi:membrane protease YdiL (CAAX protease family)
MKHQKSSINLFSVIFYSALCLVGVQLAVGYGQLWLSEKGWIPRALLSDVGTTVLFQVICIALCLPRYLHAPDPARRIHRKGEKRITPFELILVLLVSIVFIDLINNALVLVTKFVRDSAYQGIMQELSSGNRVLVILSVGVLGPVFEELLFRGILYRGIRSMGGFWVSAILTSALWGVSHMNFTQGVATFLMGLLLCFFYETYRSLILVILIHMGNNIAGLFTSGSLGTMTGNLLEMLILMGIELLLTILILTRLSNKNAGGFRKFDSIRESAAGR